MRADAEESESTCRVWDCRGRQGRQWQGDVIDVIACTFGCMIIHHGKDFAKRSWPHKCFAFCAITAHNSIFNIIIMDFYKAVDPAFTYHMTDMA